MTDVSGPRDDDDAILARVSFGDDDAILVGEALGDDDAIEVVRAALGEDVDSGGTSRFRFRSGPAMMKLMYREVAKNMFAKTV